ncbi:hypothetical protein [Cellulomonas sp. Leaf334]|uniref:hypothetical protein n=1 Tax=Cellulomonas sp. Leaf334 TaxID=1736339 RepID=UPI0006FF6281|nr:hypothetical protein [Cellulomonas sp. Leaf334]KQR08425.1 hypothetical protein ASF78_19315 [Cellulomonas sp. Leaf334]
MDDLLGALNGQERDLLRETEPARMEELDEDQLIRLHSRIRRARKKHQKNYRRRASAGVEEHGGRGVSRPKNTQAAQKAEVFEDALARVSGLLQRRAAEAAEALKQERLAAARANRSTGPGSGSPSGGGVGPGEARSHTQTTGGAKRDASSQAQGAARQAKSDNR